MNCMYRYFMAVLGLLFLLFNVGYLEGSEQNVVQSFCLEHIGPQDKPLATICFVKDKVKKHSSLLKSEYYVIIVNTSQIAAVIKMANSFAEPLCSEEYGAYASKREPMLIICRKNMKIFLQEIKQYADASAIESIDRLILRIQ